MALLWLEVLAPFCLAACASTNTRDTPGRGESYPIDESAAVECVPFARALSGIQLSGDAADWWPQAEGRYSRTKRPAVGSILVFRRSARLVDGHLAVVSRLVSDRQVLVTQANWVRDRVISDMPVIDVSNDNDWTLVRVWWPPAKQMGITEYPTFGFILPDQPLSDDVLAAATPAAIRIAISAQ